jgi:hypothetical protein
MKERGLIVLALPAIAPTPDRQIAVTAELVFKKAFNEVSVRDAREPGAAGGGFGDYRTATARSTVSILGVSSLTITSLLLGTCGCGGS